jgi:prepilin-type N-terminal cleavage/methylation domain-containing protein
MMMDMKKNKSRTGMTLVEVLIAMTLVCTAAVIVYTEMLLSYRIMMRSRARVEAQSLAFDQLWTYYNNTKVDSLPGIYRGSPETNGPTPEWSLLSTNGLWEVVVYPGEINPLVNQIECWRMVAAVWPPADSPLRIGTNPLARVTITRYNTVDRKKGL